MLNRKLLEKQRVQNRFASYEVHIGHFFFSISMLLSALVNPWKSFNPVYIQISKYFTGLTDRLTDRLQTSQLSLTDRLTERLTDGQNRLPNPFAHVCAG